jgi:hypothetical protein
MKATSGFSASEGRGYLMDLVYLDNTRQPNPLPKWCGDVPYLTVSYETLERPPLRTARRQAIDEAPARSRSSSAAPNQTALHAAEPKRSTRIRGILRRAHREKIRDIHRRSFSDAELVSSSRARKSRSSRSQWTSAALDLDQLAYRVMEDVALVSIMWANNETGLFRLKRSRKSPAARVPFHCDATQRYGKIPTEFNAIGFDAPASRRISFTAKGVGRSSSQGLRFRPL